VDLKKIFGSGKKEPFRVPREAAALRLKIDLENRENFPTLEHYKELAREAEAVYNQFSVIIAQKVHAEEALKVQGEIRKKMDALFEKIQSNMQGKNVAHGKDYVENIDYLERKNLRNQAKTRFTEFLEAYDAFTNICKDGRPDQAGVLDSHTATMVRASKEMNDRYFKVHGDDQEIQELRDLTLERIANLGSLVNALRSRLKERGLMTAVEKNVKVLQEAAQEL
jgi:hypothetical protein